MKQIFLSSLSILALGAPAFAAGHGKSATDIQAALDAAAATNTASVVVIDHDLALDAPLTYTGTAPLTLVGSGNTVSTDKDVTLFSAPNGPDLMITGLNFVARGDYSITNQGGAGKGIFVGVPTDRTGTVKLSLNDVRVEGASAHGVHISDCSLADACGGGEGGAGDGSPASIEVFLRNVAVVNVGNGSFDADGLRVDERGAGSVHFSADNSLFQLVGADGVELDEGQDGDVNVTLTNTLFVENGNYCDPAIMKAYLPDPDEGEFETGAKAEGDIPGPVTGSPDDMCIEREVDLYDDGSVEAYEFGLDLDDGFDIDEAGNGSINATIARSMVQDNRDEGFDFDEAGAGDIDMMIVGTGAKGNTDDGYKFSEEDEGSVIATVAGSMAQDNGGKGMVFEEEDGGDVQVSITGSMTSNNDDSDDTGVELVQDDAGQGMATITNSDIADGIDAEGVDLK